MPPSQAVALSYNYLVCISEFVWVLIVGGWTGSQAAIKASLPGDRFRKKMCLLWYISRNIARSPSFRFAPLPGQWDKYKIETRKDRGVGIRKRETRRGQTCYFAKITWNSRSHRVGSASEIYVVCKIHLPAHTGRYNRYRIFSVAHKHVLVTHRRNHPATGSN